MEKLYFVDGYHGGIEGHMPVGSWQDILGALERRPEWTVSLDVEPESYEWIRKNDFEVYSRLREFVENENTADRIEFLNGCYAQPFCWAIDGESCIRQIIRGMAVIRRCFPTVSVDTYSVQEPCFTSQLPQILRKLHFERMSLKNSTCWGGYMAKMPGGIVRLHAPDGTWIPAVVRYECEELYDCCATDASGYDRENIKTLAARCAEKGIPAPNGMTYQDLGWLSAPMVQGIPIEYLTYREYFKKFGGFMDGDVNFHQEDVLCALPWGTKELQQTLRAVRALEYELPRMEKLAFIADGVGEVQSGTFEKLSRAWDCTMLSQHHDAYICGKSGRWRDFVKLKTRQAGELLSEVRSELLAVVSENDTVCRAGTDEIYVRVYNTLSNRTRGVVSLRLGLAPGWRGAEVFDSRGNRVPSSSRGVMYTSFGYDENGVLLPGDPVPKPRVYPDGSEEAIDLTFEAEAEGAGYSTYRVVRLSEKKTEEKLPVRLENGGAAVETDVWDIFFDLSKGGAITRLRDRRTGKEFASPEAPLGYVRGFFSEAGRMVDTLSEKADLTVLENTSVSASLRFTTKIYGHSLVTDVSVLKSEQRIDFRTKADFSEKPEYVGDPERPPKGAPHNYRRRSGYNEEMKLAVVFNVGGGEKRVFKAAPYDVCESRLGDGTSFIDWGEIRHNIVNDYIDVCGSDGEKGIAVWCDQVTGYSLHNGLLTLTMGFGNFAGFFWGDYKLTGTPTMAYSLFAHGKDTFEAHTAAAFARRCEPMIVSRLAGKPDSMDKTVFATENENLKFTAALKDRDGWVLRLFNCSPEKSLLDFRCGAEGFKGLKCDLFGKASGEDASFAGNFEIITLR